MKPKLYFLLAFIGIFVFASCEKTKTFEDLHKIANETAFAKIATSADYTKIESQTKAGFIMYKELKSGTGATPLFTDQVKVLYTGWFKRDWTKGDTYTNDNGNIVKNKVIFDSTANRGDIPSILNVAMNLSYNRGLIDGFSTALQHMKVGDKWEIWIPWKLGYGATESDAIPAYTTLVFEVELLAVL